MNLLDYWFHEHATSAAWLVCTSAGLFIAFLAVYAYAVLDFKPKAVFVGSRSAKNGKRRGKGRSSSDTQDWNDEIGMEPIVKPRALTDRELGIPGLDLAGALPAHEQRLRKLHQHVNRYVEANPEDTAQVIKSWLSS